MKPALLIVLFAVSVVGCSGKNPAAPAPIPACQTNNTGTLTFKNRSASNSTYTISLDGATVATLAPQADSAPFTISAGVAHAVNFFYSNTNTKACNTASPIQAQCSAGTLTCTF